MIIHPTKRYVKIYTFHAENELDWEFSIQDKLTINQNKQKA